MTPPVLAGVSLSQVTEKGTERDVTWRGLLTSTWTESVQAVSALYVSSVWRTSWDACPARRFSVCHPEPEDSPLLVRHRYSTFSGVRPTVTVAVKAGAAASGTGHFPE